MSKQEYSDVDYSPTEFFPEYFAQCFKSWDDNVTAYRLIGGHIPSRHDFDRAKRKNKKSVHKTTKKIMIA